MSSSLILPYQHGFVKRRLTTTNLIELTSIVVNGFNKKLQTDVIYTDFKKSLDSVNHFFPFLQTYVIDTDFSKVPDSAIHSLFLFKLDQLKLL